MEIRLSDSNELIEKYTSQRPKLDRRPREVNSTHRWVELFLDIRDIKKSLLILPFEKRSAAEKALVIAERRLDWHYRQDSFDLRNAAIIIAAVDKTIAKL